MTDLKQKAEALISSYKAKIEHWEEMKRDYEYRTLKKVYKAHIEALKYKVEALEELLREETT